MATVTHLPLHRRAIFTAFAFAAIAWPPVAQAAQYESNFVADSEWELEALRDRGDLSHESVDALGELLRSGVALERARAEDLHELPGLTWLDVDAILAARQSRLVNATQAGATFWEFPAPNLGIPGKTPGNSPESREGSVAARLRRVAAFLERPEVQAANLRGSLELASHYVVGDQIAPPGLLRARLRLPSARVSLGWALVSSRQRLGTPWWDPDRHALVTPAPVPSVALPKWFLSWSEGRLSILAGTFRVGFAERLVLDNTRRHHPDAFQPDEAVQRELELARFCSVDGCGTADSSYAARDYRWREGFRGVAASARDLQLGPRAALDLHAFGSLQSRSIYQYEIFDRDRCVDPHAVEESCRAPPVIESNTGAAMAYATLPDVFDELAWGGRASLSIAGVGRVGATGYAAAPRWRIAGARLDFQESSNYPSGGPFGAVGIDVSTRAGPWRLSAEAARSFDRLADGGGGFGAVQRSVLSTSRGELELTLRYFDARFVNPHARPVSAPDEFEGQRARNEAGVRARYSHEAGDQWRFAASADLSLAPEARLAPFLGPTLAVSARGEFTGASPLSLAVWASHTRSPIIAAEPWCGVAGVSMDRCGRERSRAGARAALALMGALAELSLQCAYAWARDATDAPWRQNVSAWFEASAKVTPALRLRLRTHYEASDPSWATSFEAGWSPAPMLSARSRYEARASVDTPAHGRNPEHRFRLELETRF